jgi:hypothetical protein
VINQVEGALLDLTASDRTISEVRNCRVNGCENERVHHLFPSRQTLVDKIAEYLSSAGIRVWLDVDSIPPSSNWLDQIRLGIESSDSYIFVVSPDSVVSEVCCLVELPHALQYNKRLITIRARPTKQSGIPAEVSAKDWIDFSAEALHPAAFAELIWALTTDLEWVGQHTWLLGLAREWDARKRDASALLSGRVLADAVVWLGAPDAPDAPAPTQLHREFIFASRRNEELSRALASATHGEALVRNHQPVRALEHVEQAAETYRKHQISPVLAEIGLWSLSRACPWPIMWIPSRGSAILTVGWAHGGSDLFSVDENSVVRLFDPDDG